MTTSPTTATTRSRGRTASAAGLAWRVAGAVAVTCARAAGAGASRGNPIEARCSRMFLNTRGPDLSVRAAVDEVKKPQPFERVRACSAPVRHQMVYPALRLVCQEVERSTSVDQPFAPNPTRR